MCNCWPLICFLVTQINFSCLYPLNSMHILKSICCRSFVVCDHCTQIIRQWTFPWSRSEDILYLKLAQDIHVWTRSNETIAYGWGFTLQRVSTLAPGSDQITYSLLKTLSTHLVLWCHGKLCLIHKGGDVHDPSNFMPTALASTISNCFNGSWPYMYVVSKLFSKEYLHFYPNKRFIVW